MPKKQIILTMAGVMVALFLSSLDQTVVGTAMPRIISDLGGFNHYTWVTTAYMIASTIAAPITGKLTDIYGRKWFYVFGIALFLLGSLLSGISQNMTQIILSRAVQGLGAGVMMAIAFIVVGDLFSPAERGKYQGLTAGMFGLSSVIGPTLGGYITDSFSWHWIFFLNIPLGLAVIVLFIFFFPDVHPDRKKRKIDYLGVLALMLATVPAMLALTWGGTEFPWGSAEIIGMFALSAVMLGAFVWIERRAEDPVLPLWFFSNRVVGVSMAVLFLVSFGMFGAITFIPLFFQGVMGATATASGGFLTPMQLGMIFANLTSGQVLARTGGHYRLQGAIGLGIASIGVFLLFTMTAQTSHLASMLYIVTLGVGMGTTMPLYTLIVQNAVPYEVMGTATSATQFFRSIGGAVGLAIFGSVMSNSFANQFITNFPASLKNSVPTNFVANMAANPQALVSVDPKTQIDTLYSQAGMTAGPGVADQIIAALRQSLAGAIHNVFFIALFIALLAFATHLFIKEVPLRKRHQSDKVTIQE